MKKHRFCSTKCHTFLLYCFTVSQNILKVRSAKVINLKVKSRKMNEAKNNVFQQVFHKERGAEIQIIPPTHLSCKSPIKFAHDTLLFVGKYECIVKGAHSSCCCKQRRNQQIRNLFQLFHTKVLFLLIQEEVQ